MNKEAMSSQDYYLPAEWERHEGTWLQWPHDSTYKGYQLRLERTWLMMVDVLHRKEIVHIIVHNERQKDHVVYQLNYFNVGLENIELYIIPTDDVWVRDNGPVFVVDKHGRPAITNWKFNGWGNRFEYQLDDQVPSVIGERLAIPVLNLPLVLEGGAVEVNGKGTFMATRTSIINRNRNPDKSQKEIEEIISAYFGITHFIWLTGAGEKEIDRWGGVTDSHIDGAARFTGEATVLYNWTDDKSDPRYSMFVMHYEELQGATTETGKSLTLVPLPVPKNGVYQTSSMHSWRKSALTVAAYCNYYVSNSVVLVPVFGNVNDDRAKGIIGEQFPDKEIIGIDAVSLVENGGAIHCVTQQQPLVGHLS